MAQLLRERAGTAALCTREDIYGNAQRRVGRSKPLQIALAKGIDQASNICALFGTLLRLRLSLGEYELHRTKLVRPGRRRLMQRQVEGHAYRCRPIGHLPLFARWDPAVELAEKKSVVCSLKFLNCFHRVEAIRFDPSRRRRLCALVQINDRLCEVSRTPRSVAKELYQSFTRSAILSDDGSWWKLRLTDDRAASCRGVTGNIFCHLTSRELRNRAVAIFGCSGS